MAIKVEDVIKTLNQFAYVKEEELTFLTGKLVALIAEGESKDQLISNLKNEVAILKHKNDVLIEQKFALEVEIGNLLKTGQETE